MKLTTLLTLWAVLMVGVGLGVAIGYRVAPAPVEVHSWDITDPWERCLSAMEAAEIPGDMWECHEPR